MPPFGNLYGMRVYVEKSLAEDKEIAFNAGSHTELVRMAYADYERLVGPTVVAFGVRSLVGQVPGKHCDIGLFKCLPNGHICFQLENSTEHIKIPVVVKPVFSWTKDVS